MKTTFAIVISGPPPARAAMLGHILLNYVGRTSTVSHGHSTETVEFPYRGNARIALRRASRSLTGRNPVTVDLLEYGSGTARITKSFSQPKI